MISLFAFQSSSMAVARYSWWQDFTQLGARMMSLASPANCAFGLKRKIGLTKLLSKTDGCTIVWCLKYFIVRVSAIILVKTEMLKYLVKIFVFKAKNLKK